MQEVQAGERRSDLRAEVVRPVFAGTGAAAYVTGAPAENREYFDAVTDPAPYVFAFVLGITLVLLTLAFRSLVVAGTAIVLNLLSVGAAYGLLFPLWVLVVSYLLWSASPETPATDARVATQR